MFSDHRPVYATFGCTVEMIDENVKIDMMKHIYGRRRFEIGSVINGEDFDDEEAMDFETTGAGLLPASTNRQKWWLSQGECCNRLVMFLG